jgi:diguanylate cyclase (GGDEF)-like protein/PAS domain S-box-containing protein
MPRSTHTLQGRLGTEAADDCCASITRQEVRFTISGRSAHRRDYPSWLTAGACTLLTLGVVIALATLHTWSTRQQLASQAVSALRTATALEQAGVLDNLATRTTLQAEATAALALLQSNGTSDAGLIAVTRRADDYQAAVSWELMALRSGSTQAASTLNTLLGEPRFTTLDAELAAESREEQAGASSGVTLAFVLSTGIVIGAGLLMIMVTLVVRRRRAKIVAIEAIADQLAQDARIATTREETFRSLFDDSPQPMLVTRLPELASERSPLRFLSVNKAAEELYGYTRAEFMTLNLTDIRPLEDRGLLYRNLHAMRGGRTHFDNIRHCTKAGHVLDIEVDTRQVIFDGESAMIICPTDVTDRVRLRRELEHQAFHDALTGLPNRSLFGDRLEHAHQRLERSGGCYAVLMLDLDNFKTVNDSLGHAAGDDLLLRVSERLAAGIGSGDTAARLGGDEFAVLLEDIPEAATALVVAESLRAALRAPFIIAGRSLSVTATIGVATSSGVGRATDAVRNADVALYVGKADGKDRNAVFTDTMYVAAVERMTLEQDLRIGIGRGELLLMYQPKVDAQTGALTGAEALVRWNHPTRGRIPPDAFIPIAEQSGLINDVDTWVLETACGQAQEWVMSGIGPIPVAVNVSGRSLVSCKLLERVRDALHRSGLDPRLLELEITESAAVPQVGEALTLLKAIRDLGVRIAIDDFGTGYSVLSRLQGFPVDTVKIDLSFTQAIVTENQEAPIVDAMIAMGLSLGLKVVAEGVETEAQRRYLAKRRCTELQGYLISRPIGPAELVAQFARLTQRKTAASKAAVLV